MPPRPLVFLYIFYWFIIGCSRDYGYLHLWDTLGYLRVLYGLFMDYLGAVNLSNICSSILLKVKNNWESSRKSCPRDLWFFYIFLLVYNWLFERLWLFIFMGYFRVLYGLFMGYLGGTLWII